MSVLKDLSGQTFGAWTVMRENGRDRHGQAFWFCRCECGAEKNVTGGRLRRGDSSSCGCRNKEALRVAATKHGAATGGRLTPEYGAWMHMIERCERPAVKQFADYGGRGISVAPEWRHDFGRFLSDMGPRPSPDHSIDRIDSNGNYGPTNCKWSTRIEQANNKRNNVHVAVNGVTKTIAGWSRETGIKEATISYRLAAGWAPGLAVSAPLAGSSLSRRGGLSATGPVDHQHGGYNPAHGGQS